MARPSWVIGRTVHGLSFTIFRTGCSPKRLITGLGFAGTRNAASTSPSLSPSFTVVQRIVRGPCTLPDSFLFVGNNAPLTERPISGPFRAAFYYYPVIYRGRFHRERSPHCVIATSLSAKLFIMIAILRARAPTAALHARYTRGESDRVGLVSRWEWTTDGAPAMRRNVQVGRRVRVRIHGILNSWGTWLPVGKLVDWSADFLVSDSLTRLRVN